MGGKYKWPQLDDVVEYRRRVRQLILQLIDKTPLELPVTMDSPWVGRTVGVINSNSVSLLFSLNGRLLLSISPFSHSLSLSPPV